jgi:hypothetical protein
LGSINTMSADSHFEAWIVVAIVAVFVGWLLSYALVELPGRFFIKSVIDDFEPTRRMSRAVGSGIWAVIIVIIYAVVS